MEWEAFPISAHFYSLSPPEAIWANRFPISAEVVLMPHVEHWDNSEVWSPKRAGIGTTIEGTVVRTSRSFKGRGYGGMAVLDFETDGKRWTTPPRAYLSSLILDAEEKA